MTQLGYSFLPAIRGSWISSKWPNIVKHSAIRFCNISGYAAHTHIVVLQELHNGKLQYNPPIISVTVRWKSEPQWQKLSVESVFCFLVHINPFFPGIVLAVTQALVTYITEQQIQDDFSDCCYTCWGLLLFSFYPICYMLYSNVFCVLLIKVAKWSIEY